jgi:MFS family permease
VVESGLAKAQRLLRGRLWWNQFPAPLQELAIVRFAANIGAGGVLYLTPMVFHQAGFTATQIGTGLAGAALSGTVGRFISGWLLDRGMSCGVPVLLAALCGFLGDSLLLGAQTMPFFAAGELLLGMAGGLYWPGVELAVPPCALPLPSARGYALVRSADAAGVAAGTLCGTLMTHFDWMKGVYLLDMAAVLVLVVLLQRWPLPKAANTASHGAQAMPAISAWLQALMPMLLLSVIATAIPPLLQSALPLDLLRGGLERGAQSDTISALLIGSELGVLVLIQWPIGQALAKRRVTVGLGASLICFAAGTMLLALSSLIDHGLVLVGVALVVLAAGQAAFLPTSTEAVVELSPPGHGGMAMALFSQCFALSSFGAPLLAGVLLDAHGHGLVLWLLMCSLFVLGLGLLPSIRAHACRR